MLLTRFHKTAITLLSALLMVSLFASPAFAAADYLYLNVESVSQGDTKWCWAATSKSALKYLGKGDYTLEQIVTAVKGSPVNAGATYEEDGLSLSKFNANYSTLKGQALSYTTVKDSVKGWYSPIKVGWTDGYGNGHSVLIYGYFDDTFVDNVSFMDPIDGEFYSKSYNWMKYTGQYWWKWSYYYIY